MNLQTTADQTGDRRPGIQSVEIGADILSNLATFGRPVPLRSIAAKCGLPAGKVHRYLVSLSRAGLVEQDAISGNYGIGRGATAIGLSGLWACPAVKEAARAIADLRDHTHDTTFGAIWTDKGPVVCLLEESDSPIHMNIRVGALLSIHRSATGLVFAAHLPEAAVGRTVSSEERTSYVAEQNLTPRQLSELYERVRASGYAAVTGLSVPGISAVAAPIYDHECNVAMAIGLLGRDDDLSLSGESTHIRSLLGYATLASRRLGYREASGQPSTSRGSLTNDCETP